VLETIAVEDADEEDPQGAVTTILPVLQGIEVFVLPLAIMYLITDKKEQLTRCKQRGRRLYTMLVQSTATIFRMNYRI
jgi:hypothetical protein